MRGPDWSTKAMYAFGNNDCWTNGDSLLGSAAITRAVAAGVIVGAAPAAASPDGAGRLGRPAPLRSTSDLLTAPERATPADETPDLSIACVTTVVRP